MVYQQLGIHAEKVVEQVFVFEGHPGKLSHRVHAIGRKTPCNASSHPPEVGEGTMVPKLLPIRHFVQFGDAHTVGIGHRMLGNDVHSHFAEIEVSADACCSRYARFGEDIPYHPACQLAPCHVIEGVGCGIDEHLVDGIDVDVLGSEVVEVDVVDAGAEVDVVCHARGSDNEVKLPVGVSLQLVGKVGLSCESSVGQGSAPLGIHGLHALVDLKKTCPSPDAVTLQRG